MAKLMLTIDVSPALADLANQRAWREGLGWKAWIAREAERALADRVGRVCWPTERERAERSVTRNGN